MPFLPYTPWQLLAGIPAALVVILGGVIWGISRLGKKVDDNGGVVAKTQEDVSGLKKHAEEEAAQRATAEKMLQGYAEEFLEILIHDEKLSVEEARESELAIALEGIWKSEQSG